MSTGGLSHEDIAGRIGVSRARVGQIERRAFAKMRKLVWGTPDFPLLREAFEGADLAARVAADDAAWAVKLAKFAAMAKLRGKR